MARLGEHELATSGADAATTSKDVSATLLYSAACVHALATAAQTHHQQADRHATRAIELLQRAVAGSFKDMARLKRDADVRALLRRLLRE